MIKLLIIGAGGFLGAILRYEISGWTHKLVGGSFPYGTLSVNVLGSFFLGFFLVLANTRFLIPDAYKSLIAVGLLGAFTTFSTFSYETMALLQINLLKQAILNIMLNLILGLIAVWLGIIAARLV
jgi:CrcB protein